MELEETEETEVRESESESEYVQESHEIDVLDRLLSLPSSETRAETATATATATSDEIKIDRILLLPPETATATADEIEIEETMRRLRVTPEHERVLPARTRERRERYVPSPVPVDTARAEQGIASRLVELIQKPRTEGMTVRQKARVIVVELAKQLGIKVTRYAYELTVRWLYRNMWRVLGQLAVGALAAFAMQMVAPLSGYGVSAELLSEGFVALAGASLYSAAWAGAASVLRMIVYDELRDRSLLGPIMRVDLLQHASIQRMLERAHVPAYFRRYTVEDMVRAIELNSIAAWKTGIVQVHEVAGFPVPLPTSPDPEAWRRFGTAKASQYVVTAAVYGGYGTYRLTRHAARYAGSQTAQGYRATRAMLETMLGELETTVERATEKIRAKADGLTGTAFGTEMTRRTASGRLPRSHEELLDVVRRTHSGPPEVAERVLRETTDELMEEMDDAIEHDLDPGTVAFVTAPPELANEVPDVVRRERTWNQGVLAFGVQTRTAALVAGGLLLTALVARSEAPQLAAETLAELLPDALGRDLPSIVSQLASNAAEYINAELAVYHLLSNVIGLPRVIEHALRVLPAHRVAQLKKLRQRIEEIEHGLLKEERHPYIRLFVSALIGRRFHSRDEILKKLSRREVSEALVDMFGEEQRAKITAMSDDAQRDALLRGQKANIDDLNRILFGGILAQLAGTVGVNLAVRGSIVAWDRARLAGLAVTENLDLSRRAGLSELERVAAASVLAVSGARDSVGLAAFGLVRRVADEYARAAGAVSAAAALGIAKIEAFLQREPPGAAVVQGRVTHEVPSRADWLQEYAHGQGYPDWNAMKAAKAADRPLRWNSPDAVAERKARPIDEVEALLRARGAARIATVRGEHVGEQEQEFLAAITANPMLLAMGFLEYFDVAKQALSVVLDAPLQTNFLPEVGPPDLLGDDEELKKALNYPFLPLAFRLGRPVLESAEAFALSYAGQIDAAVIAPYNMLVDSTNIAMDVAHIVRVLTRANLEAQNNPVGRFLATHLPNTGAEAMARFERLDTLTDTLHEAIGLDAMIESQKVNVYEVVSLAATKNLLFRRTAGELFGEIAAVLIGGEYVADYGASAARGVAAGVQLPGRVSSWASETVQQTRDWASERLEHAQDLTEYQLNQIDSLGHRLAWQYGDLVEPLLAEQETARRGVSLPAGPGVRPPWEIDPQPGPLEYQAPMMRSYRLPSEWDPTVPRPELRVPLRAPSLFGFEPFGAK